MKKEKAIEVGLSYLYHHKKDDFTHEGFTFRKGEYYEVDQNQHYIYLKDDNNNEHLFDYESAKEFLFD